MNCLIYNVDDEWQQAYEALRVHGVVIAPKKSCILVETEYILSIGPKNPQLIVHSLRPDTAGMV